MKVFALYNIKGGVGKTATAVNLAYLSARTGTPTLIWDLDPQGATGFYFRIKSKIKGGAERLLQHKSIDKFIKGTDYEYLDLLPADFSYRHMDLTLHDYKKPRQRLRKVLQSFADDYPHVFLDCPPGLSLVSESILAAADVVLIPVIPTVLSVRTLDQLYAFMDKMEQGRPKAAPFFSMVDVRRKLHQQIVEELPRQYPDTLETYIPYASEVEQMGLRRAALPDYAWSCTPAQAYRDMWREIQNRMR